MNTNIPTAAKNNLSVITLTNSAAMKISELIIEEDNSRLNLRVFISGGGCSGFQYGFVFDENINNDDVCILKKVHPHKHDKHPNPGQEGEEEGGKEGEGSVEVRLLVDPMSFQYLTGAVIDYTSDIKGEQFIIRNPMAKTTCGCGSSFSV